MALYHKKPSNMNTNGIILYITRVIILDGQKIVLNYTKKTSSNKIIIFLKPHPFIKTEAKPI